MHIIYQNPLLDSQARFPLFAFALSLQFDSFFHQIGCPIHVLAAKRRGFPGPLFF